MKLNYENYMEKVKACWLGKNIGGTLGAPFEGKRGAFDIEYYTHDLSWGVLPNDDLDLQLVFLLAAEKYGKALRAEHLAEFWLYLVPCNWSEYGAAKNNLRLGFMPPVTGNFKNAFKNSCGCFIRSELWACLAPGHPEIAVKYAYEDGIVDHAEEGVYGEIFCAAVESAAFVETDTNKLIEIGLSYIPKSCALAKAVRLAQDCYERKIGWREARKEILTQYPDTFGFMRGEDKEGLPKGETGFDAPANIALMVMAWLFGEGEFSKSICIATGCGEDADCTAGTLAAIMGICFGMKCFDEKWLKPIGYEIKTIAIDRSSEFLISNDVLSLTDRVAKLMPVFMHGYCEFDGGLTISTNEILVQMPIKTGFFEEKTFSEKIKDSFWTIKRESPAFNVGVALNAYELNAGEPLVLRVTLENNLYQQQWIRLSVSPTTIGADVFFKERFEMLEQYSAGHSHEETELEFSTEGLRSGKYEIVFIAESNAKAAQIALPLTFLIK